MFLCVVCATQSLCTVFETDGKCDIANSVALQFRVLTEAMSLLLKRCYAAVVLFMFAYLHTAIWYDGVRVCIDSY